MMDTQNLKGKNWAARKINHTYILSIDDKSSIVDTLTDFVASQKIVAGEITGIGATNEATLRFFDPDTKEYVDKTFTEQMEISNLSGNISEVEGKLMLHLHVTLGKSDYSALAGHLYDAKVRGAGEFFINAINTKVVKIKNEDIGLNFYEFEDGL